MKDGKNVQTVLTPEEYMLLKAYAQKKSISLKEALKRAVKLLAINDTIDEKDPFFNTKAVIISNKDIKTFDVDSIYEDEY